MTTNGVHYYYRDNDGRPRRVDNDDALTKAQARKGVEIYRRSDLEMATCLHRWRHEDRRLASDVSRRGTVNHAVMSDYIAHLLLMHERQDVDEALAIRDRHLAATVLPSAMRDEVFESIEGFVRDWQFDPDAYLAHEDRIVLVSERSTVQPDLVYARERLKGDGTGELVNECEVVDFKSFYGSFLGKVFEEFQAREYLVAAAARWPGYDVYRFTFKAIDGGYQATDTATPKQISEWRDEVVARAQAIEAAKKKRRYPVQPGSACKYCLAPCPVVGKASDERIVDGVEQAVLVADEVVALERSVKRRKDALRGWVKANQNIVHGDQHVPMVTGFKPTESKVIELNRLLTITSEEDETPPNIDVAASKVQKLIDPEKKSGQRIMGAMEVTTSKKFTTWKL